MDSGSLSLEYSIASRMPCSVALCMPQPSSTSRCLISCRIRCSWVGSMPTQPALTARRPKPRHAHAPSTPLSRNATCHCKWPTPSHTRKTHCKTSQQSNPTNYKPSSLSTRVTAESSCQKWRSSSARKIWRWSGPSMKRGAAVTAPVHRQLGVRALSRQGGISRIGRRSSVEKSWSSYSGRKALHRVRRSLKQMFRNWQNVQSITKGIFKLA